MEPRLLRLFIQKYQDGNGEILKRPIYAIAGELAIAAAMDWLIANEDYTYVSVTTAPKGHHVDGTCYLPIEEVARNG